MNIPCKDCVSRKEIEQIISTYLNTFKALKGEDGRDGTAFAVRTTDILATADCPNGAIRVTIGIDEDFDNIPEIIIREFDICKGVNLVEQNPRVIFQSAESVRITATNTSPESYYPILDAMPSVQLLNDGDSVDIEMHMQCFDSTPFAYKTNVLINNQSYLNADQLFFNTELGYEQDAVTLYQFQIVRQSSTVLAVKSHIEVRKASERNPIKMYEEYKQVATVNGNVLITATTNLPQVEIMFRNITFKHAI
jgi:hypothetical protein